MTVLGHLLKRLQRRNKESKEGRRGERKEGGRKRGKVGIPSSETVNNIIFPKMMLFLFWGKRKTGLV